jgi:large subunit ribosomal protein L18e
MKMSRTTNPVLRNIIVDLAKKTHEVGSPVWRDLAERLARSNSRRAEVNVSRIARYTQKGDIVAVPGKVLGAGRIAHPVTVAAFAFSEKARQKITAAGGRCLSLRELMQEMPKGSNVKIME